MLHTHSEKQQLLIRSIPVLRQQLRQQLAASVQRAVSVDDLVQETYLRAHAAIVNFEYRGEMAFVGWLKTIAVNHAINVIKKQSRLVSFEISESQSLTDALLDSGQPTPSAEFSIKERREIVSIAISTLPDHYRLLLELRYHKELKFEEIAVEMGRSAASVRGLHRNALRRLHSEVRHLVSVWNAEMLTSALGDTMEGAG